MPNPASRMIAMAARLLGSSEKVKQCMQCSELEFRAYRAGRKEPSWLEIDRLVEIIMREQGVQIAKNRVFLDEMRKKRLRR